MPIDPRVAIGADLGTTTFSWTSSDVIRYQLALGAGAAPTDPVELRYVLADRLVVLPTFGVVAPDFRLYSPPALRFTGIDVDLTKVLHGMQSITVDGPIPTAGEAVARTRIADVWDKRKAAVIVHETVVTDPSDAPLWTATSFIYARGEGGFGGERGPATAVEVPDREPDRVIETPTLPQQALLYRMCGDLNPLHADPAFARRAGFDRPILHGLCTYGIVCKSIVDGLLDGDVTGVASFAAKFAGVLIPGETLRIRVWRGPEGFTITASAIERDDAPVLADTLLTVR